MKNILRIPVFVLAVSAAAASMDDLKPQVDRELPSLINIYKDLHLHPELSHHEEHTSAFLAAELRKLGFTVTEHVGKYENGDRAFGIAAVLANGSGPVVLMRTDMDALPVEERTGLPYASHVRTKNDAGLDVGVMHACGHDLHMTNLLGTARLLVALKDRWKGTLVLVGQPSEETIDGARAMLADDFYSRFPKPTYAIALHDIPDIPAGKVQVVAGPLLASSTSIDVIMRGLGGHGAHPEATKDPVVMAAEFVMEIQTIVSRQISPQDPAVVTVGSIHGGTKYNIIPDEVHLQITTRSFKDEVRAKIIDSIDRTARGVALAAGVPEDRAPIVKVSKTESTPVTYNDPKLAERIGGVLASVLGEDNLFPAKAEMGSEDFGLFGLEGRQIPVFMLRLGAVNPEVYADAKQTGKILPSLHSSLFAPDAEPALRTGIISMTAVVLELMK